MKRLILLFLLGLMAVPAMYSQDEPKKEKKHFDLENFKAQKMAYLIQEVNITPEESAQLFPLYNELQEKRFKLKMSSMRNAHSVFKDKNASNEDCMKALDEVLDKEIEVAQLEKTYYQKFKKILSPQKLLKLKRADFLFAQDVLKGADRREKPPRPRD